MKPLEQILEQFWMSPLLTEELRTLLFMRYDASFVTTKEIKTLSDAIAGAFIWHKTEEGVEFWERIYQITKENES